MLKEILLGLAEGALLMIATVVMAGFFTILWALAQ